MHYGNNGLFSKVSWQELCSEVWKVYVLSISYPCLVYGVSMSCLYLVYVLSISVYVLSVPIWYPKQFLIPLPHIIWPYISYIYIIYFYLLDIPCGFDTFRLQCDTKVNHDDCKIQQESLRINPLYVQPRENTTVHVLNNWKCLIKKRHDEISTKRLPWYTSNEN